MKTLESYCQTLSEIASGFPTDSIEHEAILIATKAIHFAMAKEAKEFFEQFIDQFGDSLSSAQIEYLKSMEIGVGSSRKREIPGTGNSGDTVANP